MKSIKKYYRFKNNGLYGFLSLDNKVVIDYKYVNTTEFIDKYVGVFVNNKWKIIDINENTLVDNIDEIISFEDDQAIYHKNKKSYYINFKDGKPLILETDYNIIKYYVIGIYKIKTNDNKFNFLNAAFKPIFENNFVDIDYIDNGFFKFKNNNNLWQIINIKNEIITNNEYDEIDEKSTNYFKVLKNNEWFFIDKSNNQYLKDNHLGYEYGYFSDGILDFKYKDKLGFINIYFEVVFLKKYELIDRFQNNYAIVKKYNKFGVINKNFKFVVKPIYDNICRTDTFNVFYCERRDQQTYVTSSNIELFVIK